MHKNKLKGLTFQYKVIKALSELLNLIAFNNKNHADFQIANTGAVDRTSDGRGVDIYFKPSLPKHITDLKIQCKSTIVKGVDTMSVNIKPLLDIGEDGFKILWIQVNIKKNVKRTNVANIVILHQEDFLNLLKIYDEHYRKSE